MPSYGSYSYNDISGSPFKNYIQYLAGARSIIDYCTTGNFCPTANLTRERLAYLIVRIWNLPSAAVSTLAAAPRGSKALVMPHLDAIRFSSQNKLAC